VRRRVPTLALDAAEPYTVQAAIAACHARARTATETDWPRIAGLYDLLAQLEPSPVVELNRRPGGRSGGAY
jgi:RNA polymerase sigma-70 factor (ECF subfamily)